MHWKQSSEHQQILPAAELLPLPSVTIKSALTFTAQRTNQENSPTNAYFLTKAIQEKSQLFLQGQRSTRHSVLCTQKCLAGISPYTSFATAKRGFLHYCSTGAVCKGLSVRTHLIPLRHQEGLLPCELTSTTKKVLNRSRLPFCNQVAVFDFCSQALTLFSWLFFTFSLFLFFFGLRQQILPL